MPDDDGLTSVERWRARLLLELLALGLVVAAALTAVSLLSGDWLIAGECVVLGFLLGAGAAIVRRRGAVQLVSQTLLGAMAFIFGATTFMEARLDGAGLAWTAVLPFLSVLLVGPRSLRVWAPVALGLALLIAFRPQGLLPTFELSPVVPFVRAASLILVVVTASLAYSRDQGEALAELGRVNSAKSSFLATISHELRTPLNGVLGMTEFLLQQEREPQALVRLGVMKQSSEAMVTLIDDILDIDAVERGTLTIEPDDFDVRALAADLKALYQATAAQKNLELEVSVSPAIPLALHGASDRIRQVLANLVSNAIRYSSRGFIRVDLSVPPEAPRHGLGLVSFSVRDEGAGISPEDLPKLFKPYAQLQAAGGRRQGSTGLGLVLSQQLVTAMGGRLEVESVVGAGSRFFFTLPLGAAVKVSPPAVALPPTPGTASVDDDSGPPPSRLEATPEVNAPLGAPSLQGAVPVAGGASGFAGATASILATPPTRSESRGALAPSPVLVVDDNPINLRVACGMLRLEGYEVRTATNGAEALEAVQREPFALVFMDCHMPTMDGLEATRRIRALSPPVNAIPIVALTAAALPEELRGCIDAGMDDTLTKPLTLAALRRALEKVRTRQRERGGNGLGAAATPE
jgi:signal transduction histidine kinase/ActR/RegA family two-component response regulator